MWLTSDEHSESVACLGKAHAEAKTSCSHCESLSLTSLCVQIAFFSESGPAPHAIPFSFSQEPWRKKQWSQKVELTCASELVPAQIPCASASPQREDFPVLFSNADQHRSSGVSCLVSFGGSEEDFPDNNMLLAACNVEEWPDTVEDSAPLPPKDPGNARTGLDGELVRVLTMGVVQTLVRGSDSHVLPSELENLLAKGTIETFLSAHSKLGFYSRYFLFPKKDGGLRHLNCALIKQLFKMLTLTLNPLTGLSRGLFFVSGSERHLLSYSDSASSQTVFEIHFRRSGFPVYCPSIWTVPGTVHVYEMHG